MMAVVCSVVTYFILLKLFKGRLFRCLLALLSLPLYTAVIFYLLLAVGTTERQHVSAEEANNVVGGFFKVPVTASDVNCKCSVFEGLTAIADFSVSEEGFLNWAESQGWAPRKFVTTSQSKITWPGLSPDEVASGQFPTYRVSAEKTETEELEEVKNGYFWTNVKGDHGLTVVYDLDTQKAYCSYITF